MLENKLCRSDSGSSRHCTDFSRDVPELGTVDNVNPIQLPPLMSLPGRLVPRNETCSPVSSSFCRVIDTQESSVPTTEPLKNHQMERERVVMVKAIDVNNNQSGCLWLGWAINRDEKICTRDGSTALSTRKPPPGISFIYTTSDMAIAWPVPRWKMRIATSTCMIGYRDSKFVLDRLIEA
ncbi:hypothetical protein V1477_001094 [Vespula maculifrons]|uniref:Uncharacterized protein n=1 Tax=Vespula maculifrons TaxID=7453 RepID=A0ABD2D114_VESMC